MGSIVRSRSVSLVAVLSLCVVFALAFGPVDVSANASQRERSGSHSSHSSHAVARGVSRIHAKVLRAKHLHAQKRAKQSTNAQLSQSQQHVWATAQRSAMATHIEGAALTSDASVEADVVPSAHALPHASRMRMRERTGARVNVNAPNMVVVNAALAKSFIIGDVGSSGTRLLVYAITPANKAVLVTGDPCAKESLAVPTNLDLISAAAGAAVAAGQLPVQQRIVNHLYDMCVQTISGAAANADWDKLLGLKTADDTVAWMGLVPIYFEATAGLRLEAQKLDGLGKSIHASLWQLLQRADTVWRQERARQTGARPTLGTRVIPGALEGWYGFRAGAEAAASLAPSSEALADAKHLVYIEVGGASQQIAFTLPPTGAAPSVPATVPAFLQLQTTAADRIANANANAKTRTGTGTDAVMHMDATADTMIRSLADAAGPMHLQVTGTLPDPGVLYSKSFLGDGLNRFTSAVVREAIRTEKLEKNCDVLGKKTQNCIRFPCWRVGAVLGFSSADAPVAWLSTATDVKDRPDPKLLQDLNNRDVQNFIGSGAGANMIVGSGEVTGAGAGTSFEACKKLAERVWAGKDEHDMPYAYAQQFTEVRAALTLANKNPAHTKTLVLINTKTFKSPMQRSKTDMQTHLAGPNVLTSTADRFAFAFQQPLVAAYFDTLLFGSTTLGLGSGQTCPSCRYVVATPSWTIGAADFFVGFRAVAGNPQAKREYLEWEFRVDRHRTIPAHHMDLEDPYHSVCFEQQNKQTCEYNPRCVWSGTACSLPAPVVDPNAVPIAEVVTTVPSDAALPVAKVVAPPKKKP